MARQFLTSIDLTKNQLLNALVQNLAAAPASPAAGQIYYDTTALKVFWWNGSAWVQATGDTITYGSPVALTPGNAAANGVATTLARSDHVHALPAWASAVTAATSYGLSAAVGTGMTFARADHTHGTPTHVDSDHSGIHLSALASPIADVNWGGFKVTNLATPVGQTDAATKAYVDASTQGLDFKQACAACSSSNITVSSPGATIDGYTAVNGDRILLVGQTTASENGIWIFNGSAAALTRAPDANSSTNLAAGALTFITGGSTNVDKQFVLITTGTITVGTTSQSWTQFGGGTTYSAGNGLSLASTTFSVTPAPSGGITVSGSGVAVDTTIVARKATFNVGDGTSTAITLTHNLGTNDVQVTCYRNSSPYDDVVVDVTRFSTNAVVLTFATAPAANAFRAIVTG